MSGSRVQCASVSLGEISPAASRLVAALTHFRTRSLLHIVAGEDTRAPWPSEVSSQNRRFAPIALQRTLSFKDSSFVLRHSSFFPPLPARYNPAPPRAYQSRPAESERSPPARIPANSRGP